MAYGERLLSKVIADNDVAALRRYRVEPEHLTDDVERAAMRYIQDYAASNDGRAPDPDLVAGAVDGFTFVPCEDSFEFLAKKIKSDAAKKELLDVLNSAWLREKYESNYDGNILLDDLTERVQQIKIRTHVRNKIGTDIKTDADRFIEEYYRRKTGQTARVWPSRFRTIDRVLGGYSGANVYTWYGKSGRGKSVIVDEEAIEAAMHGATVLKWSMEMGSYESLARLYVSISGRNAVVPRQYLDIDMDAGFDANQVRRGNVREDFEDGFTSFIRNIDEYIPGNIIVRAVDDSQFDSRSLRDLEDDIIQTGADVVILDPVYYLDYERNTSKTAGGDAAETSKKLRRLAGRTQTVIHAITQAEEDPKEEQGDERMPTLPSRSAVKKTKQLLEDAAALLAVDTAGKTGLIGLGKGRHGGEGTEIEIIYLPQYGIVREPQDGDHF